MRKLFKSALQFSAAFLVLFGATESYAYAPLSYDSHLVTSIYYEPCLVTLEDGSKWQVSHYDRYELLSWNARDVVPISISPNYFSHRYTYYLNNNNTGSYVRANLVEAPIRGTSFAVTLSGIDQHSYESNVLYLSNGTFWRVSSFDLDRIRNWYLDDLIIIGKNNEWLSFNTHILINIHTNSFIRAQRL